LENQRKNVLKNVSSRKENEKVKEQIKFAVSNLLLLYINDSTDIYYYIKVNRAKQSCSAEF